MELRRLSLCWLLVVMAVVQCSEAHTMHRRQTDDVNYDDVLGDEANDEEVSDDAQNDSEPEAVMPTVIETAPAHYEVDAGGDIRLECKVSNDRTVIQWYKDNDVRFLGRVNVKSEQRYNIATESKDLLIKNAQVNDSGVWRCEIMTVLKNPVGINHTLLVLQQPMIINTSATNGGYVAEGSDLKLTCLVTGSPAPSVLWSITRPGKDNERILEKDAEFKVEGNLYSMFIRNVRKENAGKYYCYGINSKGHHQAEIDVVVRSKPRVHVPKTIINSDLNVEAVLECSAHEEPRAHIRWYKDGALLEDSAAKYVISTRGQHSNLTVSPTTDADFGTFTCEAVNEYGAHNRSIELVQHPVVEELSAEGAAMTWVVHSHQPLEEMEVELKPMNEDGEWRTVRVPLPSGSGHKYEIKYILEDEQLQPGDYQAVVKVKNSKSWGGSNEPAVVRIGEIQPLSIQHASVYRPNNAHSIRPVHTVLSSVLMYLLVRML